MNYKEKQIEEMAKVIAKFNCNKKDCDDCDFWGFDCDDWQHYTIMAEAIYNAGYRKLPENAVVLTDEEQRSYLAYKVIEPQIKGCLDRERELKKQLDTICKETTEKIFSAIFGTCNTELNACNVDLEDNGGQYWEGKLSGIINTIADIVSVAKQFGVEVDVENYKCKINKESCLDYKNGQCISIENCGLKQDKTAIEVQKGKAVLVIDMPTSCDDCSFLDDNHDYPTCIVTDESEGYNFKTSEKRMKRCPLRAVVEDSVIITDVEYSSLYTEEYKKVYEQAKADVLANVADGGTSCHWCIDEHEKIGYNKGGKETARRCKQIIKSKLYSDNQWVDRLFEEEFGIKE